MEKIRENEDGEIEIFYDRKKIRALLRAGIFLIGCGLLMHFAIIFGILMTLDTEPNPALFPVIVLFLLVSLILMALAFPSIYKYSQMRFLCESNEAAIILGNDGISFYESGMFSGISESFVYWDDIAFLPEQCIEKWIPIFVKNPEAYLSKKSILKRAVQRLNMKACGTPLIISHTYFTLSNEMLCELIRETLQHRFSR